MKKSHNQYKDFQRYFACDTLLLLDLEEEFQDHIKYLFDHITHPDKLHVKKIGGQHATCAELCNRMKAFASMLEQDKALEDVKSIIQVQIKMILPFL